MPPFSLAFLLQLIKESESTKRSSEFTIFLNKKLAGKKLVLIKKPVTKEMTGFFVERVRDYNSFTLIFLKYTTDP